MSHSTIRPADVAIAVKKHPRLVLVPVAVVTLLALVYAIVCPTVWEASQALVVRDEAGDSVSRPGKFAHLDEMRISQETILELAGSRSVLLKALAHVGPPADADASPSWPDEKALEQLQNRVKITPPKGAEFGQTEVFYLKVQDENRARAIVLASAICVQLQDRLAALREATARSTTNELTRSVGLAREDLATATVALTDMEQRVGNDLPELRILSESPSGDSDLRRTAIEVEKELRAYRAIQSENEESLKLLDAAQANPEKLLASPSVLLKSQPAMARLKDDLVDAQLRSVQALGTMSEEHPLVLESRESEHAIRQQLHDEIGLAINGVEADLRVNTERIGALEEQSADIQGRLNRLAVLRAEYANRATEVKHRSESLNAVEHELAEARASQAAAGAAGLINLVDAPDAGPRPLGPGRTMIVAGGFACGVLIAAALLFLLIPPGAACEPAVIAETSAAAPLLNGHSENGTAADLNGAKAPSHEPRNVPVRTFRQSTRTNSTRPATPLTLRQALERVAGQPM